MRVLAFILVYITSLSLTVQSSNFTLCWDQNETLEVTELVKGRYILYPILQVIKHVMDQRTMLLVCTDDLYYKREADWVGHKFRSHPWRYQELITPMGPEAHKAVY